MPYYERWDALKKTIQSFEEAGYFSMDNKYKIEVVICDDGSVQEPIPKGALSPSKIIYLPKKKQWLTPCVPINRAVAASTGRYIVLQSPETWHTTNVINAMADMMTGEMDTVQVACLDASTGPKDKWFSHPDYNPGKFWFCQMLTRTFFDRIGGFDEDYRGFTHGEDGDFAIRLSEAGAVWKWLRKGYVVHGWKAKNIKRTGILPYDKLEKDHGKITRDRYITHKSEMAEKRRYQ